MKLSQLWYTNDDDVHPFQYKDPVEKAGWE